MAEVEIQIAGHRYVLSCREGDEEHLRAVAGVVHAKALDAGRTMGGGLGETRQLLFAALLLADENADLRAAAEAAPPTFRPAESGESDAALAIALERLADRMESLANRVEAGPPNA